MNVMRIAAADSNGINQAADIIKSGGLVALPTETVYGLGADAFNAEAVAKIYAAKGRPGDNPLILHIAEVEKLMEIAAEIPDYAHALIEKFWPGPLTLVVRKKDGLPAWLGTHPEYTAETVGIRMPAHPVMLAVIREASCIIAAPSANKAGKPSPTCATHVVTDYEGAEITPDLLLDGDRVDKGVESTVVDVTGKTPVILRHGMITVEMLDKAVKGLFSTSAAAESNISDNVSFDFSNNIPETFFTSAADNTHENIHSDLKNHTPRAPGMKYRHYAPIAPMTLLRGTPEAVAAYITTQIVAEIDAYIGVLVTPRVRACIDRNWPMMAVQCDASYTPLVSVLSLGDADDLPGIVRDLYANLRKFDTLGVDIILAEALGGDGLGAAIMDRMTKAAEGRVIQLGIEE